MKLISRIVGVIGLILLVVIVAVAVLLMQMTQGPLPQHEGELDVEGLQAPVTIFRDDWGVPHIYAANTHDLFFAQGYTQAQDRWWQMEFSRHVGSGSVQELTGKTKSVMGADVFIRKAGWRRAAEQQLESADEEDLAIMQAFADGVNAYIMNRTSQQLAIEYSVLGLTGVNIEIKPWEPIDTAVWAKAMAWNLSGNEGFETKFSELTAALSPEMIEDYIVSYPFGDKPTIVFPDDLPIDESSLSKTNVLERDFAGIRGLKDSSREFALLPRDKGLGSNNWVVDGERTETGMPLLANDPHLGIGMPSIWYEIGLHCAPVSDECPFNVVGFSFPAQPLVIIGHNERIAWGVTNVGPDTQDLYLIKVNPDNELQYEWNGEWRDMEVVDEVIDFGDGEPSMTLPVRLTHLGPIMNDNKVDDDGNLTGFNNVDPMALRWTALESGTIFKAVVLLNQASNWEDFREAMSYWDSPSQNTIYADIDGNIGYQTPGLIPVRAAGHTGQLPVDGSTDKYEWKGYVPYDLLPRIYNPDRGFVASANQALVPLEYYEQLAEALADEYGADSEYVFDYRWDIGYRGERIVELLTATEKHTIDSFKVLHADNQLTVAKEVAPYISELTFADQKYSDARDWMLDWDYQLHMDSGQGALFVIFWGQLVNNLYPDNLGDIAPFGGDETAMWSTRQLMDDQDNVWWDDVTTDAVETRDEILVRSFIAGYDRALEVMGEDRSKWAWGNIHQATFKSNPLGLSGVSIIENLVNRGPYATSGGNGIINKTAWNDLEDGDFGVASLPSMRMIVDFSDLSNSLTMHTTGQSGHPFGDQYNNMVDSWRNIEYHPMLWTREDVEAAAVEVLELKPAE